VNFDPEWMAVVTWNLASTYYRKYYMDEVWVGVVTSVFMSSPNVASFSYTLMWPEKACPNTSFCDALKTVY